MLFWCLSSVEMLCTLIATSFKRCLQTTCPAALTTCAREKNNECRLDMNTMCYKKQFKRGSFFNYMCVVSYQISNDIKCQIICQMCCVSLFNRDLVFHNMLMTGSCDGFCSKIWIVSDKNHVSGTIQESTTHLQGFFLLIWHLQHRGIRMLCGQVFLAASWLTGLAGAPTSWVFPS